jgi:hypothetical protein
MVLLTIPGPAFRFSKKGPNRTPNRAMLRTGALALLLTGLLTGLLPGASVPMSALAAPKAPAAPASKSPVKKSDPKKAATDKKADPEATAKEIDASIAAATRVESLELLQTPDRYLNRKVTFTGTFNRFADIALDYKKAFRDSRDYVTFFILRPDVSAHTIPLSEMKLFFPRKKSSEVMELESGDKIQIVGVPFSTALDEPWIDVEHIKILEKTAKPERKHAATPEF